MKSAIVTGATSMIGVALIKECIKNNVEVLAIVRRGSARMGRLPQSGLLEVCECNMDELSTLESEGKQYDVFYHLAWSYTSKDTRDNPILQECNIKYTLDAVELAHKLSCHKFIGAGSQAEYGPVHGMIMPDTAVNPNVAYGTAKYAAGKLSRKLCDQYGIAHIWGRVFSVYGRYDNEGTMLVYAANQFLKREPARFSAGTQMWDYLHESDAGKIFFLLGERVNASRIYCIASGAARPLKEFIMEMRDAFGEGAECEFETLPEGQEIAGLQTDTRELEAEIGYKPMMMFKEGIIDMIRYKKQGGN